MTVSDMLCLGMMGGRDERRWLVGLGTEGPLYIARPPSYSHVHVVIVLYTLLHFVTHALAS